MTHADAPQYIALKTNLDIHNNILKKSIWLQKKLYYEAFFEKYKHDIKKMWKTINEVLNKRKKKKSFPEYFKNENEKITDKLEITNHFKSFFINIGKNLAKTFKYPENCHFTDYMKEKFTCKLQLKNVDNESIIKIIDALKLKTSYGFDGISTKLIKKINILS